MRTLHHRRTLAILAATLFLSTPLLAQEAPADPKARTQKLIDKGLAYLKSQQADTGGWAASRGATAISALALKAFTQDPAHAKAPAVKKGFEYLLTFQNEDGGIYKDSLALYNTAISVSALASANDPAYRPVIDKAVAYMRKLQWSDKIEGLPKGETVAPNDPRIGGWGYGSKGRPDGSNTSMALDALRDAGVSQDDPMFKQAALFMSKSQNLKATNDAPWATNDGGFIYSPANGGETFAGSTTDDSGKHFNSYGSMTYAGLKSLVYAGISKDDPRVVAAWQWISTKWTLDENPGMSGAGAEKSRDGMFYYYHVLARALHEFGQSSVPASAGSLDWRLALIDKLEKLQNPDGSWKGGKAYMEENPVLVTSYSVLALEEVLADLDRNPPAK